MSQPTIWVGLDVHQDSIAAAVLEGNSRHQELKTMTGDLNEVRRFFRQLSTRGPIRACYEASGAGFVLHRTLAADGFTCDIIAPSMIPRAPGDRIKTDRRDAIGLVQLFRNGSLRPIHVPTKDQEALRGLVRQRLAYQELITATKNRISAFLRSSGLRFSGTKSAWTKKHRVWLQATRKQLAGPSATTFDTDLNLLEYLESVVAALDAEIARYARSEDYRPLVEALMCLRGVKTLTAMTLVTEIGDPRRFASPTSLMSWAGVVPSESSSGNRRRQGSITKTGNRFVRRVLVEAAHNHRHRTGANLIVNRRRQGQDPAVVAIALKAQHRLFRKFHRLIYRKHHNVAVTAVARELCGFVWAIMNQGALQKG